MVQDARASAISAAVPYRACGSFSSARITTPSTSGGKARPNVVEGGTTRWFTWAKISAPAFSASKGGLPESR